jgi:hypothetical protein
LILNTCSHTPEAILIYTSPSPSSPHCPPMRWQEWRNNQSPYPFLYVRNLPHWTTIGLLFRQSNKIT